MALAELQAKLEHMHAEQSAQRDPLERARRLQRENTEMGVRLEKQLEEIAELRTENDALRLARDQLVHAQAAQQGEDRAMARMVQAEKESLQRRASHLTQETKALGCAWLVAVRPGLLPANVCVSVSLPAVGPVATVSFVTEPLDGP